MAEDAIKEWVDSKLDEGVDKERLKSILKDKGHDPSIVDEVDSPFESDTADSTEEEDEEFDFSFTDRAENNTGTSSETTGNEEDTGKESDDSSGMDFGSEDKESSFSMPEMPDIDTSGLPVKSGAILLVLLIGAGLIYSMGPGLNDLMPAENTDDPGTTQEVSLKGDECPENIGVRIDSFESNLNSVDAEVVVSTYAGQSGPFDVVLELYEDQVLVDSTTASIEEASTMSVEGSGDEIVFRPANCAEMMDREVL